MDTRAIQIGKGLRAAGAIAALGLSLAAHASVGLYSTGVDNSGNPLPLGTTDAHYTVSGGAATFAVNDAQGFIGSWLGPNTTSEWITPLLGPGNTASSATPGGDYLFTTTFDLTGINLSTSFIAGHITADNGINGILINGHSTGFTVGGPFAGTYSGFTPFSITSGFQAGINTLTFDVVNGSGPVGLRVDYIGSTFLASAVPEPQTWMMLLAGLGVITSALGRRRRA